MEAPARPAGGLTEVEPRTVLLLVVGLYLSLGLFVGPLTARRIVATGHRSPRRGARRFAGWVTGTWSGRLCSVVLWPVIAAIGHWGFLAGRWDWRGLRDPDG